MRATMLTNPFSIRFTSPFLCSRSPSVHPACTFTRQATACYLFLLALVTLALALGLVPRSDMNVITNNNLMDYNGLTTVSTILSIPEHHCDFQSQDMFKLPKHYCDMQSQDVQLLSEYYCNMQLQDILCLFEHYCDMQSQDMFSSMLTYSRMNYSSMSKSEMSYNGTSYSGMRYSCNRDATNHCIDRQFYNLNLTDLQFYSLNLTDIYECALARRSRDSTTLQITELPGWRQTSPPSRRACKIEI